MRLLILLFSLTLLSFAQSAQPLPSATDGPGAAAPAPITLEQIQQTVRDAIAALSPPVTPPPVVAQPSAQVLSVFAEIGLAPGNQVTSGLGLNLSVGNNQSIFAEATQQVGQPLSLQATNVLFGIKSNLPGFTVQAHKITPFMLVAYGASIQTLATAATAKAILGGVTAGTITGVATAAGLAQRYGGGFQGQVGKFTIGVGYLEQKDVAGWAGYPFSFVGMAFGK